MNKPVLYEIARIDESWGFWAEGFNEAEMLQQVKPASHRVEGTIPDENVGVVHVMRLGNNRKEVVAGLPKKRTFFKIPLPAHEFSLQHEIRWVGHIGCFPHPIREQMLREGFSRDTLIAMYKVPGEEFGAITVTVDDDAPIPMSTCCDMESSSSPF